MLTWIAAEGTGNPVVGLIGKPPPTGQLSLRFPARHQRLSPGGQSVILRNVVAPSKRNVVAPSNQLSERGSTVRAVASALDTLIGRVADERLRSELRAAAADLRRTKDFGLVFESHIPESVRLPHHPIRRGVKVAYRDGGDAAIFEVVKVSGSKASVRRLRTAEDVALSAQQQAELKDETVALDALVVIAEFGDPIYPGLRHLGSVSRGGDRPAHVVINGENHHALEALAFSHAGKVNCIYIDPPYNTGARDWKYSNDYVDSEDSYRHSKWLAFMERRLRLAKVLLNVEGSVLICTIDAREVHRTSLLLEQVFPGHPIQMATIVINPSGAGNDGLNRVDEYAFFVSIGGLNLPTGVDDMLTDNAAPNSRIKGGLSWESFLRSGTSWYRSERPNLCYPIVIDPQTLKILGSGPKFQGEDESTRATEIGGYPVAWPIRTDGKLGIWRKEPGALATLVERAMPTSLRSTRSGQPGQLSIYSPEPSS